jgi:hypothetical protein
MVTVEDAWAQPGPPVERVPVGTPSSMNWGEKIVNIVGGVVDIFGRQIRPPVAVVQKQPESISPWVYLAIPVVLVGAVLLMRRPRSVAGYRKRRSRRSRR